MEGFRSLDENEDVEFIVALGKNGLEAADVKGMNGVALRGHSIRPKGRKQGDKLIRLVKLQLANLKILAVSSVEN
jgi:hypothetical protein